jgi:hypothetical protein
MGRRAQYRHSQRMVVFSAVEERDLSLRKSDACRERLDRRRTAVMCLRRGVSGYGSRPRLPVDRSRRRKRYCRGIEKAEVNMSAGVWSA